MSDREEDQPRFQGSDDDVFVQVECVVYDQSAGEAMAARIIDLEHSLTDCAIRLKQQVDGGGLPLSYRACVNRAFAVLRNEKQSCATLKPTTN